MTRHYIDKPIERDGGLQAYSVLEHLAAGPWGDRGRYGGTDDILAHSFDEAEAIAASQTGHNGGRLEVIGTVCVRVEADTLAGAVEQGLAATSALLCPVVPQEDPEA